MGDGNQLAITLLPYIMINERNDHVNMRFYFALSFCFISSFFLLQQNLVQAQANDILDGNFIHPFVAEVNFEEKPNAKRDYIGVLMQLPKPYKSYWRMAGASGVNSEFQWLVKENIANIEIFWPLPSPETDDFGTTYYYQDNVTLPIKITRIIPQRPAKLEGILRTGICDDICIPVEKTIIFDLPIEKQSHIRFKTHFDEAIAKAPRFLTQEEAETLFSLAYISQNTSLQFETDADALIYGEILDETGYASPLPFDIKVIKKGKRQKNMLNIHKITTNEAINLRFTIVTPQQAYEFLWRQ